MWGSVLLFAACGSSRGGGGEGQCDPGDHWANPDGRGGRCVADRSTCDEPLDCPPTDAACCDNACADPTGRGVYGCVQSCTQPECTVGSCGADLECNVIDACEAYCIPVDTECGPGTVPADPYGNGQFVCVADDSECLRPADCAGVAVDPCCGVSCSDAGAGRYTCQQACAGAGAEAPGVACMCSTDDDCVRDNGPGWTCQFDGGCLGGCWCAPPPDCDCVAGAYVPVCGTDGVTYDAACGDTCVPVEIACRQECPCA